MKSYLEKEVMWEWGWGDWSLGRPKKNVENINCLYRWIKITMCFRLQLRGQVGSFQRKQFPKEKKKEKEKKGSVVK